MMYNNKLAACVKANGKVLREFKDTVYIPFGAEYSIFVKNLDSVRAIVKVQIDGQYIDDGSGFVVYGNNTIDLERFIKNGNWNAGNRFKFIERSASVENHRGVKTEDGLIRIEYQFEKRYPNVEPLYYTTAYPYRDRQFILCSTSGGIAQNSLMGEVKERGITTSTLSVGADSIAADAMNVSANNGGSMGLAASNVEHVYVSHTINDSMPIDEIANEVGITVEGSISDQKFVRADWFATESEKHVIVLKLLGETEGGRRVQKAVTVKHKPKCKTCGHVNKGNAKFCSNCGTSLIIV